MDADKAQHWNDLIERQQSCGFSQRAFCEQNGVSLASFRYWKGKLAVRSRAQERDPSPEFIQLELPRQISAPARTASGREALVVELPNGVVLRFFGVAAR